MIDRRELQGIRSVRIIEPYSLRRTQAGDIVLHAVRSDNQQHRSYRIERIRGARTTQQPFRARYAIELTPTGPISAPPTNAPRISSPRMSTRSRSSTRTGPVYVYQCGYCNKKFEHSMPDPKLREHKTKDDWRCSGHHGIWIDTKW